MDDPKTTQHARLTVVEEGTEFTGSMSSSCPVVVKGGVSGELSTPALTVTPTGTVSGRVRVGTLVSHGLVAGEIDADQVSLAGQVADATVLRARTLDVKLESDGKMTVTFGQARLEVGDAPERP
jgi:cytoskeletal protein CcmA (bactofilin family)